MEEKQKRLWAPVVLRILRASLQMPTFHIDTDWPKLCMEQTMTRTTCRCVFEFACVFVGSGEKLLWARIIEQSVAASCSHRAISRGKSALNAIWCRRVVQCVVIPNFRIICFGVLQDLRPSGYEPSSRTVTCHEAAPNSWLAIRISSC